MFWGRGALGFKRGLIFSYGLRCLILWFLRGGDISGDGPFRALFCIVLEDLDNRRSRGELFTFTRNSKVDFR